MFDPEGRVKVGDGRRHYNDLPFLPVVPGPPGPPGPPSSVAQIPPAASTESGPISLTVNAPIVNSGTDSEPDLSISAATDAAAGSMSAADKTKVDAITAAGLALIDDASVSAQRTTLGLGTAAIHAVGDFDAAGDAAAAQAASQPLDSDLTAIAALSTTSFGRAFLALADAAASRTYIGAGTSSFSGAFSALTGIPTTLSGYGITDAQPLDSDLTAIAALTTTSFGRAVLALADAAALRTAAGLGTLATQDGTFSGTSSGTNTGDQTTVSGNAGTATALQTARAINGTSFDGTAAITVTAAAGTLTGATLASGVTASSLTSFGTNPTIGLANGTGLPESGVTSLVADLALKAPLASPTFTGTVTLPNTQAIASGSMLPAVLLAQSQAITTGAAHDIVTLTVPAGITRWAISGSTLNNTHCYFVNETQTGTMAAGTVAAFTAAGGGGTQIMATTAPAATSTPTLNAWSGNALSQMSTSSSIVIRQMAPSANTGTISFYLTIIPIP